MKTREDTQVLRACTLAHVALQAVEAHTRAGHLRCPVCGVQAAAAHAAACTLAQALAALDALVQVGAEAEGRLSTAG